MHFLYYSLYSDWKRDDALITPPSHKISDTTFHSKETEDSNGGIKAPERFSNYFDF